MIDRALAQHARPAPDLVGQHDRRLAAERARGPLVGRPEHRRDRHAERRGEVHRAGVVRDEAAAVDEHARQRRQIGPADEIERRADVADRRALVRRPPRSPALPTSTAATPSRCQRRRDGRRTTWPASAWRRRRRRLAQAPSAASRRSQPALPAARRRPAAAPPGRRARGSSGPLGKAELAHQMLIERGLMHAARAAAPPRQQRRRGRSVAIAPALRDAGPPRRQAPSETNSAAAAPRRTAGRQIRGEVARDGAAMLEDDDLSNAGRPA